MSKTILLTWLLCRCSLVASAQSMDDFEAMIKRGNYQASIVFVKQQLDARTDDDQVRFQLGALQFLHAFESAGQAWYRLGYRDGLLNFLMPTLRMNVDASSQPEPITYQQFRAIFQQVLEDLAVAELTLSEIDSAEVALVATLSKIGMDFNRNQIIDPEEQFGRNLFTLMGGFPWNHDGIPRLETRFDYSDVYWLRGYCHLISSIIELAMAYDLEEFWNVYAGNMFPKAQVKYDFLQEELALKPDDHWSRMVIDAIAAVHLTDLKLQDAARVRKSHEHLTKMVSLSRQMWASVQAETDDDREWIPNPRQTPPFPGGRITEGMVVGWQDFLNEFDDILAGRKLIPFWRGTNPARGVNLHRAMLEPQDLDLILWIQGVGAIDYLQEDLPVSPPGTWQRINEMFQGDFFGFAVWVN